MLIEYEAKFYVDVFQPSLKASGGMVAIVPNLNDLWNQSVLASDKTRVLICCEAETVRGPFSRAAATHRVDRQWKATITRGRGYASNRGTTLTEAVDGVNPFYQQVQIYRDGIRAITATSAEYPLDWKGFRSWSMGGMVINGFLFEWSTAHDLPVNLPLSPQTLPH